MKRLTVPFAFLYIFVLLVLVLVISGCYKPYAKYYSGWKTDPALCVECHSRDQNFHVSAFEKHADIHCLECHILSDSHVSDQFNEFDGIYENVQINEGRCILCHPTDKYSNPGHWKHLGINAQIDSVPMKCTNCHTNKHELTVINDCSVCHQATVGNAQSMAIGHCTICHGFDRTTLFGADRDMHPYSPKICDGCHTLEPDSTDPEAFIRNLEDPHIKNTNCAICHNPHKAEDASVDLTCRRCHKQSDHDKVAVHTFGAHLSVACEKCHIPHNFELAGGTDCSSCHGEGMAAVPTSGIEAHQECSACHTEGDFTKANPNSCNTCHKSEATKLAKIKSHGNCGTCHTPHKWENPSTSICKSCHSAIFTESVASKKKCSLCHDSHSASKSTIPDSCAKCHSKQNSACKDSAIKSDCSLCHTAHGWSATWDSCTTCHDKMESGGHPKHIDFGCESCHTGHNWSPTARSVCLACHPDYEEHMESSMLCTECHWN